MLSGNDANFILVTLSCTVSIIFIHVPWKELIICKYLNIELLRDPYSYAYKTIVYQFAFEVTLYNL